jgi:hypothetical protein
MMRIHLTRRAEAMTVADTEKIILLCPTCQGPVIESYKDDIQQQWYACEQGHRTAKPIKHREESQQENNEKSESQMTEPTAKDLADAARIKAEQDGEKEEKDVFIQRASIVTADFIAEEIWNREANPQYLRYNFASKAFDTVEEIGLGETNKKGQNIVYVPINNEALKKGLVIVPSGYTQTSFKEVFEDIDKLASTAYDACGQENIVTLLTRVTVGSWFLDRFVKDPKYDIAGAGKFAPIIPIRGPSQTGKNRLAFILRLISYRPYFEMSTYRIPSLYRPLDIWQGTLVLDEADFANTNEKSELIHFLNCRATGTPVSRQNPKNPKYTDTFANFGITICTQRKPFDDNATESRALPYYSEATDKKIPVLETDEMLNEGYELQNKLIYLRMIYYKSVNIDKSQWIDDLTDHRLIATLLPMLALSEYEPDLRTIITDNAKAFQRAKIEEKANSMDGTLINCLWEKIKDGFFAEYQNE